MTRAPEIFRKCVDAIDAGVLIHRESQKDKEFHFQNWFVGLLEETGLNFEQEDGTATQISDLYNPLRGTN